jgi:hypothetical protein
VILGTTYFPVTMCQFGTVCLCISQQRRTQTATYLGGMHRAQVCSGTTRRAIAKKLWVHRCQANKGSGPQFRSQHRHYSRSMHRLQVLREQSQRERCNMTTVIQTYPISKHSFFSYFWKYGAIYVMHIIRVTRSFLSKESRARQA